MFRSTLSGTSVSSLRTPEDFLSAVLPWGVLGLHRSGSGSLARKVSYITLLEMEEHLKS
ncbi:hypothetical protein BgiMline_031310, partial [Biomphalaria glabrata]